MSAWLLTTCDGCDPVALVFGAATALLAIVIAIALGMLETHRRREWVLIGNLGVTRVAIAGIFAIPAVLGEAGLQLVRTLAG